MAKADLTAQRLRELLHYDPETGDFAWRVNRRGGAVVGDIPKAKNHNGYAMIGVDHVRYRAHRLAWLYVHGHWPTNFIDHINGIRDDNRIANLREATSAENLQNMRRGRSDSAHGFLGITWHKANSRWCAQIADGGRHYYLGSYKTNEEAQAAYRGAKRVLHPFGPDED